MHTLHFINHEYKACVAVFPDLESLHRICQRLEMSQGMYRPASATDVGSQTTTAGTLDITAWAHIVFEETAILKQRGLGLVLGSPEYHDFVFRCNGGTY